MTTLNLWQCDTCSRTYAADVAQCTAPTCTNILPLSAKERLICDASHRAGIVDEVLELTNHPEIVRGVVQMIREQLTDGLRSTCELFTGHGLHKTGERQELRHLQLTDNEVWDKAAKHTGHWDEADGDSGQPHAAHGAMRNIMLADRAIKTNRAKENAA